MADLDARRAQSREIEARLIKLRRELSDREDAKNRILDLQMQVLENDAGNWISKGGEASASSRKQMKTYVEPYVSRDGSDPYRGDRMPSDYGDGYSNERDNQYPDTRSSRYDEYDSRPTIRPRAARLPVPNEAQKTSSVPDQRLTDESPKLRASESVDTEPVVEQTFAGEEIVAPQEGKKEAQEPVPDESAAGKEVSPPKSP